MASKKREPSSGNSLAGWSEVIKRSGEQSRAEEAARKESVRTFLEGLRHDVALPELLRALVQAHDDGRLRTVELLDELRRLVKEDL